MVFFMKPIKKYFSLKVYRMLPICRSLLNQGVIIIQSNQHNLICWSKLLQQIDVMDILHTDDKVYYLPLEQNALEKNMAWLTCSNRIKICQCYAIPYPKIVISSFLNDDTKLIYECFIVKNQHRWRMSVYKVFEIIRSGAYFILYFFPPKAHSNSYGKRINNPPSIEKLTKCYCWQWVHFFWDKFVKHFSFQFQQLNWFCQSFDAKH